MIEEDKTKETKKKLSAWSVIIDKFIALLNRNFKKVLFCLFIFILILGYFVAIKPKIISKNNTYEELNNLASEVKGLQENGKFLSRYSEQLIEFTPEEERKLSLALPDKFDLPSVIIQLSKLASDYRFIVEDVQFEEMASSGSDLTVKRVDIEASIVGVKGGDYNDFSKFVEAIESSLMIFDVRAINFNPDDAKYSLELATYYYPQE